MNEENGGFFDKNKRRATIAAGLFVFLLLPGICCISLGIRVNRLQRQVERLRIFFDQYGLLDQEADKSSHIAGREENKGGNAMRQLPEADKQKPEAENEAEVSQPEKKQRKASQDDNREKTGASKKEKKKKGKYADKEVYLTFDDGPSRCTGQILDILKKYKVKATFFVVGKDDKTSKALYCRIVEEGHTLGMHSYSHKYSKIYNSVQDFHKDFTKLYQLLYDATGRKPTIYRFPGGSSNSVSRYGMKDFIRYLNKAGIVYYDWNVVNGDASEIDYTEKQMIENVLGRINIKKKAIVLMHDAQDKQKTVNTLPGLLDILISEDANILPLNNEVKPIQAIKASTVK